MRSRRPLRIHVTDAHENLLFEIYRPFYFFSYEVEVFAGEEYLGKIRKPFSLIYKKYELEDASTRVFGHIKSPFWRLWTFPVLSEHGVQVGIISKKWGGIIKEMFTDADQFGVEFEQLEADQRVVLLYLAICIDFDYFEDNSNRHD